MISIQPADIQIIGYTIVEDQIEISELIATQKLLPTDTKRLEIADLEVEINNNPHANDTLLVSLVIANLENSVAEGVAYKFKIGVVGHFSFSKEFRKAITENKELEEFGVANCANILYGACREYLVNKTSRMPGGQLYLPICYLASIPDNVQK
jgi:hypothetical protein